MPYAPDLSEDFRGLPYSSPGTRKVGWLGAEHPFPTTAPTQELLDLLWLFCSISVVETRGIHLCEFCPVEKVSWERRGDQRWLLGMAEMRVFSQKGQIYAAPNLIYHYVAVHHYRPPDEFIRALREGLRPPRQEYFARLAELNLEWSATPADDANGPG